jgi:hypothetical protein
METAGMRGRVRAIENSGTVPSERLQGARRSPELFWSAATCCRFESGVATPHSYIPNFIIAVVLGLLALTTTAAAATIEIDSIEELQLIGNDAGYPLDGDYALTQDIDASATATWNGGQGFAPIGTQCLAR